MALARFVTGVFLVLAAAHGAHAQKLYRCGSTFSQTPCGADAQEIKAAGVPQPIPQPLMGQLPPERYSEVRAMCEQGIREQPAWKDPDSVKIRSIVRGTRIIAVTFESGRRRAVAPWYVTVNAKNGFGAYAGERLAECYFDPDEKTLLSVYLRS